MKAEKEGGFTEKEAFLSFNDYTLYLINLWDKVRHWDTLRHYQSSLNKFNEFALGIALKAVTPEVLQGYQNYCIEIGNEGNTVWAALKFIRIIINKAIKDKKITQSPFTLFDMPKYRNPKRPYLNDEQIAAINDVRLTAQKEFAYYWVSAYRWGWGIFLTWLSGCMIAESAVSLRHEKTAQRIIRCYTV